MRYLAFAENITHTHGPVNDKTKTINIPFGESEFPPLKPMDEGWQLVSKNYDQDEPYSIQHQQEEDWQCIVDGHSKKQKLTMLYAQIAQEAATLPPPPSRSFIKKTPPTTNFMNKSNNNDKENEDAAMVMTLPDDDIGNELFAQYKSSSWLRRRYHRLSFNHRHHPALRHHVHNNPSKFLHQPSYHLQRDQQESTNGVMTKKHPKSSTATPAKRRPRTTKKQPTRTWIERENGWVAIHAKIHSK